MAATSGSAARASSAWSRRIATSRSSSRATRCTRTSRPATTSAIRSRSGACRRPTSRRRSTVSPTCSGSATSCRAARPSCQAASSSASPSLGRSSASRGSSSWTSRCRNLDAKLRVHTRTELKTLQRELGTTMVFVTHDQAEAMSLAHRIAVLSDGELQQIGTPDEVYDRPANVFVAEFIGSPPMNLIEARPRRRFDRRRRMAGGSPARIGSATVTDGTLTVGLRPEGIADRSPTATRPRWSRSSPSAAR